MPQLELKSLQNISSYQTLQEENIGKVVKQSRSSIYKLVHISAHRVGVFMNSLPPAIDGHDHSLFNELCARMISQ
jgi:hypothetical protein